MKKVRYKALFCITLANCWVKGTRKMWILWASHVLILCWTKGILTHVTNFLLLSYTLFQGNTKLLDMQWPVYGQIIWHYFQSHDHAFAAFSLIP